jgi:hypothetical protein
MPPRRKLLAQPVKSFEIDDMILAAPFLGGAAFRDDGPCPM